LPAEVPVIIPPPARAVDDRTLDGSDVDAPKRVADRAIDPSDGELAAIEAGWDELLA
jgi:hypothetical protein